MDKFRNGRVNIPRSFERRDLGHGSLAHLGWRRLELGRGAARRAGRVARAALPGNGGRLERGRGGGGRGVVVIPAPAAAAARVVEARVGSRREAVGGVLVENAGIL